MPHPRRIALGPVFIAMAALGAPASEAGAAAPQAAGAQDETIVVTPRTKKVRFGGFAYGTLRSTPVRRPSRDPEEDEKSRPRAPSGGAPTGPVLGPQGPPTAAGGARAAAPDSFRAFRVSSVLPAGDYAD